METSDAQIFVPPRRRGVLVQGLAALGFTIAALALYWQAARLPVGQTFLLYLLAAVALSLPVPFLLYGLYALRRAEYRVDRNRLALQWGWRLEEIPMNQVLWARPAAALDAPLPLPRWRWPGKITGRRRLPDGTEAEFMAAEAPFVVVATETRWFVLSPAEPEALTRAIQRAAEAVSLEKITARSQSPAHWLQAIWRDHLAKGLLLTAWLLTVAMLVGVNLAASGSALPGLGHATPAALNQAVWLAITAWMTQGMNLGLGLFAYPSPRRRPLAYLVWLGGALAAVGFLLSAWQVLGGKG